ncbi:MAG: hypothetical protein AB1689_09750 [Thermodesulfobacteriota bacterium]
MADVTVPNAIESYGIAWRELQRCFLELLLVGVVWLLLSAPSGWLQDSFLGVVYHVLVLGPVSFGGMYAFLRAARGDTPQVGDLFVPFQRSYAQAVLASLLVSVLVAIGMVLLIVPGVIAAVRLAWVPYLVVDERMDAAASIRESWERTRGYGWTIFAIFLIAIPLVLIGLVLLVVGVIPAMMLVQLASAVLFAAVSTRLRVAREAGVAVVPP